MQRNIGSEIMIAVGAILIIGFGLVFAVLLTGNPDEASGTAVAEVSSPTNQADVTEAASDEPTEEASPTEEATATDEPTDESTATEVASPTDEPTATDEPTEEASPTDEATETEEAAATEAASATEASGETQEASATNEAAETEEPSPTTRNIGRATRVPTETDEPEASATNTRRPSATPQPTDTPRSTDTQRPTNTPRPSATPSPTLTERPSATPTSQSAVSGIIPTPPPSPTLPPLGQPSRTPSTCQLPQGWTSYTVQAGNTLFAIALATNSTVDELRTANCIENIDNIHTGDVIYVPRAPIGPVATFVNTGSRAGLRPIGCQNPNLQITSPISAQRLNGTFTVYGSANRSDFLYYKIEIRPDAASIYNFYMDSRTQVTNGVLGEINSELFGSGLHWIKLTLVDTNSSIPADATCEIPVIFE